jgi:hypothetical protein
LAGSGRPFAGLATTAVSASLGSRFARRSVTRTDPHASGYPVNIGEIEQVAHSSG